MFEAMCKEKFSLAIFVLVSLLETFVRVKYFHLEVANIILITCVRQRHSLAFTVLRI